MVKTFQQPSYPTAVPGTAYPGAIDDAFVVLQWLQRQFAPHEAATPDLTVVVDQGQIFVGGAGVNFIAQQTTSAFTAPTTNPRIDRITVGRYTGTVNVVTGVEAASPTPPAVPADQVPVAQVRLETTTTTITNDLITDERDLRRLGGLLINDLPAATDVGAADLLALFDDSLGEDVKIDLSTFFAGIDALTALTSPATTDRLPIYDLDGVTPRSRSITAENLLTVINALPEDTSPDLGADWAVKVDAVPNAAKIGLSKLAGADYQPFNADGTWNKPAGKTWHLVEAWAGGGGGSGGPNNGGSGGGGAGFNARLFHTSELPATVAVGIGAGGPSQEGVDTNGGEGGNTTFGSYLTAYGGGSASRRGNGETNGSGGGGGRTGKGENASINLPQPFGGDGGPPEGSAAITDGGVAGTSVFGGGGGADTDLLAGSTGGDSHFAGGGGTAGRVGSGRGGNAGWGGGGGGGSIANRTGGFSLFGGDGGDGGTLTGNGQDGAWPGGGGGGGGSAPRVGGDGADGFLVVTSW